jgi:hypothetical protein
VAIPEMMVNAGNVFSVQDLAILGNNYGLAGCRAL